jgi:tetratricopeptide (TPR) repeat protein
MPTRPNSRGGAAPSRPGGHHGESDEEELALESQAAELQQAGLTDEALGLLEQAVRSRRKSGSRAMSARLRHTLHAVADLCNSLAMQRLSTSDFYEAKVLLHRAEGISERESSLRAITYNNLACLHRRQGHLRTALRYLHEALDIESALSDAHNPSDTHLNICAIQSQLGRHELALEHAQAALVMLHDELFDHNPHSTLDGTQPFPPMAERMSVLAIAYHNMGVEQEFLARYEAALLSYKRAMQLARLHVGEAHPVSLTLSQAYASARRTISRKLEEREQKRLARHSSASAADVRKRSGSARRCSSASAMPHTQSTPPPIPRPSSSIPRARGRAF